MKKIISLILCLLLVTGIFSACSGEAVTDSGKLRIVTTIFPEYDWVCAVLGNEVENAEITMLMDNGVDLHSYQPTADDIIKLSSCDLFIYVGGESDDWADAALKEAVNKDMKVINLLEVLGDKAKDEEHVDGMQDDEHDDDEHEEEKDEHVWLSLKNAQLICQEISDAISNIDSENKSVYEENTSAYLKKLSALDDEYQKAVDGGVHKTLVFGDRFPFRYLADDYGIEYYAAFSGCSAETEASFETVSFLSGKIDELGLDNIITLEGTEHKIAETVVQNTESKNQKVLTMDSMQSTTSADVKNGVTYLSVMEKNLTVLKEALG